MSDIASALEFAADLVTKGWTTGAYARDANGSIALSTSPEAVCWCAQGAITVASRNFTVDVTELSEWVTQQLVSDDAGYIVRKGAISSFNDQQTHFGPVAKLFRDTAARARGGVLT